MADYDLTSQHSRMMAVPHTEPRPTFRGTIRYVYSIAGLRGFFAGLTPSLLRAFPSNACAFYVYEGLMRGFKAEKVCSVSNIVSTTQVADLMSIDSPLDDRLTTSGCISLDVTLG